MSTTAQALITSAYDVLGVYQPGETPSNADAQDALTRLQMMMSLWRLQPGLSTYNVRESFPIVAGKGSTSNPYTVGTTGDLVTTRPLSQSEVVGCALLLNSSSPAVEVPRALITDDQYQAIQIKDLTNPLFTSAYYNPTYASNLGTLNLWPVPDGSQSTNFVWYRNLPIVNFTSLTASVDLPEGVEEPIVYNLAIRVAAPNGKLPPPDVVALAAKGIGWVKRMNTRLTDLPTDPALTHTKRGGYNILTGTGG